MNKSLLAAALLALVLTGLAWKISTAKAPQTEITRSALYLGLLDKLNDVTRIELQSNKFKTTLKRANDNWILTNRDDFPADPKAVKRLLLQLADLEIVEAKTSLPASYGRIGVTEPGPGSDSMQVELYGAKDEKLVAVILGHTRDGGQKSQRYVRRVGEPQSWLVNGKIESAADPISWLDARIADVDSARVRRLEITPQTGPSVVIEKAHAKDNFFELRNLPSGRVARSKSLVSSIGALLLDLRFNNVAAAARYGQAPVLRHTLVQTFDGVVAHIEEIEAEGKTYTRFDFDYDAKLVQPPAVTDDSTAQAPSSSTAAARELPKEAVAQEAARLKARVAGWVYELPDYKTRLLSKRLDDLVRAPGKDAASIEESGAAAQPEIPSP